MKKLLLIFVLLLSTVSMEAQMDSLTVETSTVTETERIVDKYSEKIGAFIASTAEALKVPASHVYKILVTQAIAEAITYLILGIISIILLIIGIKSIIKEGEIDRDDYEAPIFTIIGILLCVIGGVLFTSFLFTIDNIVTGFVNPEYYAIHEILDILK